MTIGKTIAFSLFLHTLLLFAALLSVRHIISGERILFVELTANPDTGRALNKGTDLKTVKDNFRQELLKKEKPVIPSQEQKKDYKDDMKEMREDDRHKTEPALSFHEEALKGRDVLLEAADKSGYGLEERHSPASSGMAREVPSGNSPGDKTLQIYQTGDDTGGQSLINQIRASIERAKIYPELARKRKQEGTVVTEFSITSKGMPENIRIMKSSGYNILDSAARDTIIRAAPLPLVKGSLEVPITFILK